ncbi:hypothetical protein AB0945_31385 [Streptomyces sp. NPDC005474]
MVLPEIREAIIEVRQDSVRRSRISRFRMKDVPSYDTLARIW